MTQHNETLEEALARNVRDALAEDIGAGLARLGWSVPDIAASASAMHGPLMICAFFGTVISLERAVAIDDCDIYFSGGQYELLDTHITNSRLILNHPAKGMYNAVQIFKMKSPGSRIVFD